MEEKRIRIVADLILNIPDKDDEREIFKLLKTRKIELTEYINSWSADGRYCFLGKIYENSTPNKRRRD